MLKKMNKLFEVFCLKWIVASSSKYFPFPAKFTLISEAWALFVSNEMNSQDTHELFKVRNDSWTSAFQWVPGIIVCLFRSFILRTVNRTYFNQRCRLVFASKAHLTFAIFHFTCIETSYETEENRYSWALHPSVGVEGIAIETKASLRAENSQLQLV